jgi:hypothetical protein
MTRALTALNSGSWIAIFARAINLGHGNDNENHQVVCHDCWRHAAVEPICFDGTREVSNSDQQLARVGAIMMAETSITSLFQWKT